MITVIGLWLTSCTYIQTDQNVPIQKELQGEWWFQQMNRSIAETEKLLELSQKKEMEAILKNIPICAVTEKALLEFHDLSFICLSSQRKEHILSLYQ